MSVLNLRDYDLKLELSIPEVFHCTNRDVWIPITNIDFPTFEITSDYVGLFPNLAQGRDLSQGVEDGYEPKPCDYYSVPRVNKKGDYKIHCSMFIKTKNDREIKQCLETWLHKIYFPSHNMDEYESVRVPSVIKGYSKDNWKFLLKTIKCTRTFLIDLKEENSMFGDDYIDFTFICEEMIEEKQNNEVETHKE